MDTGLIPSGYTGYGQDPTLVAAFERHGRLKSVLFLVMILIFQQTFCICFTTEPDSLQNGSREKSHSLCRA